MGEGTLQERLAEVMTAMKWGHADLVRVSKQSSSAVSQWLGKGSKTIHSIGKLEAAIYIEQASGFAALWVAKGIGPKMASHPPPAPPKNFTGKRTPTPSDWQLLEDLNWIPAEDRKAIQDDVHHRAEKQRVHTMETIERLKRSGPTPD